MILKLLTTILVLLLVLSNTACFSSKLHVKKERRVQQEQVGSYVKQIVLSGFILNDKKKLDVIVKPYQKKYLSRDQIDQILKELSSAYLEAGFAGLVSIHYELHKNKLLISIDLKK